MWQPHSRPQVMNLHLISLSKYWLREDGIAWAAALQTGQARGTRQRLTTVDTMNTLGQNASGRDRGKGSMAGEAGGWWHWQAAAQASRVVPSLSIVAPADQVACWLSGRRNKAQRNKTIRLSAQRRATQQGPTQGDATKPLLHQLQEDIPKLDTMRAGNGTPEIEYNARPKPVIITTSK